MQALTFFADVLLSKNHVLLLPFFYLARGDSGEFEQADLVIHHTFGCALFAFLFMGMEVIENIPYRKRSLDLT